MYGKLVNHGGLADWGGALKPRVVKYKTSTTSTQGFCDSQNPVLLESFEHFHDTGSGVDAMMQLYEWLTFGFSGGLVSR